MSLLEKYKSLPDIIVNPSIGDGHLDSIKYMHANVDWDDEIYRMARGLVLDAKTGEILARPYDKFFNLGQILATPELSEKFTTWRHDESFTVTEKIDGSLAIMYDDHGELRIASSGSAIAMGLNYQVAANTTGPETTPWIDVFKSLHSKETVATLHELAKTYTIIFEYVTPNHTIVIHHDEQAFILHGIRNTKTGEEVALPEVEASFKDLGISDIKFATIYPEMHNVNDISKQLYKLQNFEGFVIRFHDGFRLKMKTEAYVTAHSLTDLFGSISVRKIRVWIILSQMELLDDLSAKMANNPFRRDDVIAKIIEMEKAQQDFQSLIAKAKAAISQYDRKTLFTNPEIVAGIDTIAKPYFKQIMNILLKPTNKNDKISTDENLRRVELKFIPKVLLPEKQIHSISNDSLLILKSDMDYFVPNHPTLPYTIIEPEEGENNDKL